MEKIKISVIVPVYNTSKYLNKCLDSIINQSLKEIEIICVNDGSTDNSLDILKEYQRKDSRIIIINKKNGGLTSARNCGINISRGKYCLNIDSDDFIGEDYLTDVYEIAEKKNLDILITDIIYYRSDSEYIESDLNITEDIILTGNEYIKLFFKENFLGYTWNKLIKTSLYKEYKLQYNENIFLFEDIELILRITYFCKRIGKLNKAYYYYRQGENNGVRKVKLKNFYDLVECFNSLKKFFSTKEKWIYDEIKHTKKLFITSEVLSEKYLIVGEDSKVIKKYLDEIKNEKYIFNKFTSKNKRIFGAKERIFLCFSFNLIKFISNSYTIMCLRKLRKILRG